MYSVTDEERKLVEEGGVCMRERERERERENQKTSPLRMDKFSVHRSLVWDNSTWGRQECLRMLPVLAVSLKIAKRLRTSLTLTYCSCRRTFLHLTLLQGCFCLRVHLTGACVSGTDKHYAIIIYNMNKCYRNKYERNDIQTTWFYH